MDSSWWANQSGLSSAFRVIALDPRAQGRSEMTHRGLRLGRQAKDMYELLEHLDVEDVVHVAWSRSTSIALAYWELFGAHRLSALTLIGVTPCMSKRSDWEWGFTIDPREFQRQILADHESVVRGVVEAIFLEPPPAHIFNDLVKTTLQTPPLAGARMLEDHGIIDWRDMLETVEVPTLVCVGRYDRNAPLEAAEYVAAAVPNAQLAVFEHSAHAPFIEEPDLFNERLLEFIDQLSGHDGPEEGP